MWISQKGVRYILSPKRGMATDINARICQPITAKGQSNWTGSFISPDIIRIEKDTTIGGTNPTKIFLNVGVIEYDGKGELPMLAIRKLTPKECWRLMCYSDEDFAKAESVNSQTQLYKQAGNGICVCCLEAIFGQLIEGKENFYKEKYGKQ